MLGHSKVTSSAETKCVADFIRLGRSLMKMMKCSGDRWDTCGTLQVSVYCCDWVSPTLRRRSHMHVAFATPPKLHQKLGYPRITMDTAPGATGATAAISKAPQPKNWWRNTKAVVQLLRRCRFWISWILEKLVFHLSS